MISYAPGYDLHLRLSFLQVEQMGIEFKKSGTNAGRKGGGGGWGGEIIFLLEKLAREFRRQGFGKIRMKREERTDDKSES